MTSDGQHGPVRDGKGSSDNRAEALKALLGGRIIGGTFEHVQGGRSTMILLLSWEGEEVIPGVRDGGTRAELVVSAPHGYQFEIRPPKTILERQPKPKEDGP